MKLFQRSIRCIDNRRLTAGGKRGYTLAELLAVMLIMVILMGVAVNSFYGMGRGARLRGAVSTFNTTLALTRQYAVTRNEPMTIELRRLEGSDENDWRYDVLREDGTAVRPTQYVPPGIRVEADNSRFTFMPDGSLWGGNEVSVEFEDELADGRFVIKFTINGLTGLVTITED